MANYPPLWTCRGCLALPSWRLQNGPFCSANPTLRGKGLRKPAVPLNTVCHLINTSRGKAATVPSRDQDESPQRTPGSGTGQETSANDGRRHLATDFAGWIGQARLSEEQFFREGLMVLDANVLLDLYRITPNARGQVLDALRSVGTRLWVPHQAALEFSRNRRRVVLDRTSEFTQAKRGLQAAAEAAIRVFEDAVDRLEQLRDRNETRREWDRSATLDKPSLLDLLGGLMTPALEELDALAAEHDLHPSDMQGPDPLLPQIDDLIGGRIGAAYTRSALRALVEEAQSFRYPNQIPPGFRDAGRKSTPLLAAGDFVLWNQTIDKASEMPAGDRLVSLITSDMKPDWWALDDKSRPHGPLPELVQELRDSAAADLQLLTLKDFVDGAAKYLSSPVSDKTLRELQKATAETAGSIAEQFLFGPGELDLLSLTPIEFEYVVRTLFIRMDYEIILWPKAEDANLFVRQKPPGTDVFLVNIKLWMTPISAQQVRDLADAVAASGEEAQGMLVTAGSFTREALSVAPGLNVTLVDATDLVKLLARVGIRTRLGPNPPV
jgi:hypothetical protein